MIDVNATLRAIVQRTRPDPNPDWDWNDHAAAWSARIDRALWTDVQKGMQRTRAARAARKLGLLDGNNAPRTFRAAIDNIMGA